jgi:hypothetical protein
MGPQNATHRELGCPRATLPILDFRIPDYIRSEMNFTMTPFYLLDNVLSIWKKYLPVVDFWSRRKTENCDTVQNGNLFLDQHTQVNP